MVKKIYNISKTDLNKELLGTSKSYTYTFASPRKSLDLDKLNNMNLSALQDIYSKVDSLMYHGYQDIPYKTISNSDANMVKEHKSFKSESTNPVDVGLPATVTNLSELETLIDSAVNYLELHQEKVEDEDEDEVKITCITGITNFKDKFSRYFNIEDKIECIFAEHAGNNIIICNTNSVQIYLGEMGNMSVNGDKSDDNIYLTVRVGIPIVSIPDPKQSLFYRDVLTDI